MLAVSSFIKVVQPSLLCKIVLLSLLFGTTITTIAQDVESSLTSITTSTINAAPCTRLFRVDGEIGCGTLAEGVTGYLWAIDSPADLASFLALSVPSSSSIKYAILLPPAALTVQNLTALSSVSYFAGIVAIPDPIPSSFSPAPRDFPLGAPQEYAWNPAGRDLMFSYFSFPMVAVDTSTGNELRSKAYANMQDASSYPQWAINFQFFMGPTTLNSVQCLDNESCLPLGGQSVWGALGGVDGGKISSSSLTSSSSSSSSVSSEFVTATAAATGSEGLDKKPPREVVVIKPSEKHASDTKPAIKVSTRDASSTITTVNSASIPTKDSAVQRPAVMAVCAMDAGELFHDLSFGADSTVSSLVSVLAAADALSRTPSAFTLPYQIFFGLFQAEAWGRIGSRRWVGEVQSFTCEENVTASVSPTGRPYCAFPLRSDVSFSTVPLTDIHYVLAADQLGRNGSSSFFVHTDTSPSVLSAWMSSVLQAISSISPLPIQVAVPRPAPPPTPVLSFQQRNPDVGAAVFSEYDAAFSNPFFFSRFDTASNVDPVTVTAAATTLAQSLYALAANMSTPAAAAAAVPLDLVANTTLVQEMLACITVNAQCDLFSRVLGIDLASLASLTGPQPLSLYASVYNQPYSLPSSGYVLQPTLLEAFVRNSLAYFTATPTTGLVGIEKVDNYDGTTTSRSSSSNSNSNSNMNAATAPAPAGNSCKSTGDCQTNVGREYECLQGKCLIGNAFYHDALSPALAATRTQNEYNINPSLTSQEDPLWTEPFWSPKVGVTLFLKDSPVAGGAMLGGGLALTAAAIVGCKYLVQYLDSYFKVP